MSPLCLHARRARVIVVALPFVAACADGPLEPNATPTTAFSVAALQAAGPPGSIAFHSDRSGNRAPFAPRHIFSLWTSKHFASGLGVALGLRSLSEQFVAEDNRFAIDGYTTLDAMLSYEVRKVRLRLNLRNLTGTEYETRGFGAVSAIPARPFEAIARVEVGLGKR